jgi:hypothetical protein
VTDSHRLRDLREALAAVITPPQRAAATA